MAVPLFYFFALAGRPLLRLPAGFVFYRPLFQMIQSLPYGDTHILRLSQADQRAIARADGDFRFVTVLLDCENNFRIEFIAQDLAQLRKPAFYFLAGGGVSFRGL